MVNGMAKGFIPVQMEVDMSESGKMGKQMVLEVESTLTAQNTLVNG